MEAADILMGGNETDSPVTVQTHMMSVEEMPDGMALLSDLGSQEERDLVMALVRAENLVHGFEGLAMAIPEYGPTLEAMFHTVESLMHDLVFNICERTGITEERYRQLVSVSDKLAKLVDKSARAQAAKMGAAASTQQ